MQKWKVTLSALLMLGFVSSEVQAETQAPVSNAAAGNTATSNTVTNKTAQNELPAPIQDHMIEMMQDDFSFQNQKRALSNELELETLRGAIQKAKGITAPVSAPVMQAPADNTPTQDSIPNESRAAESVPLPKILLVSEIGGISRVAVSFDKVVKLVQLNERFTQEGHIFVVSNSGHNMPTVKEIIQ